ncbi:hypothetical protein MHEL_52560 [Mycolicibacterium helvum]|uniref:Uncharacterized protein n=1 Tax=Mycolicibacterium helvum TaxID=1534349 RepID=A0A7I7TE46_9MYCO|nr:hypothetical protein MHEL_52560 [Mycolicibacterium helvum]
MGVVASALAIPGDGESDVGADGDGDGDGEETAVFGVSVAHAAISALAAVVLTPNSARRRSASRRLSRPST